MSQPIRIGIVGAGNNTRNRHIPGFRAIDGVELVGVVNSSPESTQRAAAEFDIPQSFDSWQQLIASDDIDAVMIGTWPYLHCEITCAALDSGKHVLCEARMARDATEARRMLETSQRHPELAAQIVPSPFGLVQHDYVMQLLADGFPGELRELVVIGATDLWGDRSQPLHWRQDRAFSGLNVLSLGILHEAAMRWTPQTRRVFAQSSLFETERPASKRSPNTTATVPDSLQVVTRLEGGAAGVYHFSGITRFGPGNQIHLYGSEGTIKLLLSPEEKLLIGRVGEGSLREAEIPEDQRGGWRVEAEFIGAIRGEEAIRFTDFATGVRYMEFTEAVHISANEDRPVELPLD